VSERNTCCAGQAPYREQLNSVPKAISRNEAMYETVNAEVNSIINSGECSGIVSRRPKFGNGRKVTGARLGYGKPVGAYSVQSSDMC
jgi:hypothetical protein